jgi:hypothetical protein
MTPRGVAALMLAPLALMGAVGWALGLDQNDPAWLALTLIPYALTNANLGIDDVIRRGRRDLRRCLELTGTRIRELAQIVKYEIQKAYQSVINTISDRAAARPSHGREAAHLQPPRPRLVAITLCARLLPIPRIHARHDKGIGRA